MTVRGRFGADEAPGYDEHIRRGVPGYDLLQQLVRAQLRARLPTDARVLVIGAGTGAEVHNLAAAGPGWSFTAVDPAEPMLDVARRRADEGGYADRVLWVVGHLDVVPDGATDDAAVMLLVSHFVPTGGEKEALFAAISSRLVPGAPLVFADVASTADPASTEAAMRRAMGEDLGLDVRAAEVLVENSWNRLHPVDGVELDALLAGAGFEAPRPFFQALGGRG